MKVCRKIGDANKKYFSGLTATTVLNTKISEVENKIPDVSGLAKKEHVTMLKYPTLRKNILLLLIIANLQKKYLMQR